MSRQQLDRRHAVRRRPIGAKPGHRHWQTVEQVLNGMRGGARLHRHFYHQRTIWALSTGSFVASEIATVVLRHPFVIPLGDGLFGLEQSQTYEYRR